MRFTLRVAGAVAVLVMLASGCSPGEAPADEVDPSSTRVTASTASRATPTEAPPTQPEMPATTTTDVKALSLPTCTHDIPIEDGRYEMSNVASSCAGWHIGSPEGQCQVVVQSGNNSGTFDDITINPARLDELNAEADLSGCILYEPPKEETCGENREHSGRQFSWRPSQDDAEQVRKKACGALLRTARCHRDSENAYREFRYDPETLSSEQAEQEACGPRTSTCPSDYEHAGVAYTYGPAEQTAQGALDENCGQRYRRGSWLVTPLSDALRGTVGSIATQYGTWIGDRDWTTEDRPQMGVQCRSDTLGIWVHTGGYVGTAYRRGVQVQYRFGNSGVVSQDWAELISGSDSSAGAWIQAWQRASFVDLMRQYEDDEFVIAVYGYDGAIVGVASFDMTGITLSVDPILKECDW